MHQGWRICNPEMGETWKTNSSIPCSEVKCAFKHCAKPFPTEIQLHFATNVKNAERKGKKRREHQPHVIHAHNCTRHEGAGMLAFYLIYWCHPGLPVDIFGLVTVTSPKGNSGKWDTKMKETNTFISGNSRVPVERNSTPVIWRVFFLNQVNVMVQDGPG